MKADRVFILPDSHRSIDGIITALDQTTDTALHQFSLVSLERGSSHKRQTFTVTYNPQNIKILFKDHHTSQEPANLVNGQVVSVRGLLNKNELFVGANIIVIHPERFRGFIADTPDCVNNRILVVTDFKRFHSLKPSNTVLLPLTKAMVEISDAKLLGENKESITCSNLKRSMAVKIAGQIIQPIAATSTSSMPIRVKATSLKQIPVDSIAGQVLSIAEDHKSFELKVPVGKHGFDLPSGGCPPEKDCTHFNLKVVLSEFLENPDPVVFDDSLVGETVHIAGFFRSEKPSAGKPRQPFFLAIVVRKGLPPPDPPRP